MSETFTDSELTDALKPGEQIMLRKNVPLGWKFKYEPTGTHRTAVKGSLSSSQGNKLVIAWPPPHQGPAAVTVPEGAILTRHRDVPAGWQWSTHDGRWWEKTTHSNSDDTLVLARPVPDLATVQVTLTRKTVEFMANRRALSSTGAAYAEVYLACQIALSGGLDD